MFNKDYSVASGADAAWIDNIVFPPLAPVVGIENPAAPKQAEFVIRPNPATDHAELFLSLPVASAATVTIYDVTGNKVREVINQKNFPAGLNHVVLDIHALSPGIYFCVINAEGSRLTEKLVITK
jgi:hypothetical protein